MTDLDKLIAAVEAGNTIAWGLGGSPSRKALPMHWHDAMNAYLGSLDAGLRLHRDLFADWVAVIHTDGGVVLSDANMDRNYTASCNDNPARAWLLAVLRALKAQEAAK